MPRFEPAGLSSVLEHALEEEKEQRLPLASLHIETEENLSQQSPRASQVFNQEGSRMSGGAEVLDGHSLEEEVLRGAAGGDEELKVRELHERSLDSVEQIGVNFRAVHPETQHQVANHDRDTVTNSVNKNTVLEFDPLNSSVGTRKGKINLEQLRQSHNNQLNKQQDTSVVTSAM